MSRRTRKPKSDRALLPMDRETKNAAERVAWYRDTTASYQKSAKGWAKCSRDAITRIWEPKSFRDPFVVSAARSAGDLYGAALILQRGLKRELLAFTRGAFGLDLEGNPTK